MKEKVAGLGWPAGYQPYPKIANNILLDTIVWLFANIMFICQFLSIHLNLKSNKNEQNMRCTDHPLFKIQIPMAKCQKFNFSNLSTKNTIKGSENTKKSYCLKG